MSLYLKYRPLSLGNLLGNTEIIASLQDMLEDPESCPQAFLLHGPTGCGKTTIGRIIAHDLGCHENDFKEIDSADFRGIDSIREIRKKAQYKPMSGTVQVFLIDECHKLTNDAQNALLKLLEDTPKNTYLILATTDPQKLLATIKGRCSQFQVKPLNEIQMMKLLRSVVSAEGIEGMAKAVYQQIIDDSFGHPRNALQILDQVIRVDPEKRLETAMRSAEEQSQSIELCRALLKKESWGVVSKLLRGLQDQEAEGIRRHVLGYASAVLIKSDNYQAALILDEFRQDFFYIGHPGLTLACYSCIKSE